MSGKKRAGGRRTLSTEITMITMITALCSLILLGLAMILVFLFIFLGRTQDDLEYVLTNTSQQFQDNIQFIEDGAIAIRHNTLLREFFAGKSGVLEEAETQLSYNMELFSERNVVRQQIPFVQSVYLFNRLDECVYEHYYPMILSERNRRAAQSRELETEFRKSGRQYSSYSGEDCLRLCFHIFDEELEDLGICLVDISREAIRLRMQELEEYRSGSWAVAAEDRILAASDGWMGELAPFSTESGKVIRTMLGNKRVLCTVQKCGFGLWVAAAAGVSNVYALLWPSLWAFLSVLFLALLAAAGLSLAMSYRFTKPMKTIVEGLRAFGQEEFGVRMEDYSIQEFHEIGTVFNEMADRIQYLITQVYEKELLAAKSQVNYLQAQINPHFQFNILSMLAIKAKMAGNEELYQCLHAFSRLIQGKIFRGKEIKIPVSDEIEIVSFYLLLQNSRFEDKITYEIRFGEEAVKQDLIPRLLIEPLVENAVSHGLEPKEGDGRITVDIFEEEERLHIRVSDNGVGFEGDWDIPGETGPEMAGEDGHTHTGLYNTGRLLQILYGEDYQMTVTGVKEEGTTVEIVLPVERRDPHVEGHGG